MNERLRRAARLTLFLAAALAGFQVFLWTKVQFWLGAGSAAVLALAAGYAAVLRPSWAAFRVRMALVWSLIAVLAILSVLPIREGAISSRSFERAIVAVLAITALLALCMAFQLILRSVLQRHVFRKPVLLVLTVGLVAFLSADLLHWVKPSAVSALACTATVFHTKPDAVHLLQLHHATIVEQAARNDLPAALVAAVIVDHQNQQTASGDFSDCAGSALGLNLSLGLSQMRLSTAAQVDARLLADLSPPEYRKLRASLLNPESNIAYESRELRALMERRGRFPGMTAAALLHDPAAMALLVSEYRKGRMPLAARTLLNINAFSTLELMQSGAMLRFDRLEQDPEGSRTLIREYLRQIYCDSGIFNDTSCVRWTRKLPGSTQGPTA